MLLHALLLVLITFCSAQCYNSKQGYTCGTAGSLLHPKVTKSSGPAMGPLECFQICEQSGRCKSIGYDADTQNCQIFKQGVESQGFQPDNSSNVEYWDEPCFGCTAVCPQPTGTNLLANPGFDQWENSILPWINHMVQSNHTPRIVSPGYDSAQAYETYSTAPFLNQKFQVCPSTTYLATLYRQNYIVGGARANDSSLSIELADVSANLEPLTNVTWTPIKFLAHTTTSAYTATFSLFTYLLRNDPSSYVQLDQFSVEVVELQAASTTNLLSNGGFENGLSPWVLEGPKSQNLCNVSDDGFQSAHSFQCKYGFTSRPYKAPSLQQQVATTEDTAYVISFDYKVTFFTNYDHCAITYSWGVFEYLGIPVPHDDVALNGTWQHFESSVYANHPTTNLAFQVSTQQLGGCIFNLDNISLVEAQ